MAATLLGQPQKPRPFLYREFSGYGGHQAVWAGDWKGIRTGLSRGKTVPAIELYNLAEDEGEDDDLADRHPERVAEIKAIMEREHVPSARFALRALDGPAKR